MTVIGASNISDTSKQLQTLFKLLVQTKQCDTVAYYSPETRVQDLTPRVKNEIARNTDVSVLHLGTDNVLDEDTDGQFLLRCDDPLNHIEREQHQSSSRGTSNGSAYRFFSKYKKTRGPCVFFSWDSNVTEPHTERTLFTHKSCVQALHHGLHFRPQSLVTTVSTTLQYYKCIYTPIYL